MMFDPPPAMANLQGMMARSGVLSDLEFGWTNQHITACIEHGFSLKHLPGQIIATSQDLGPPKCSFFEGKSPKLCREFYVGEILQFGQKYGKLPVRHMMVGNGWKTILNLPKHKTGLATFCLLFFLQTGWTSHYTYCSFLREDVPIRKLNVNP